MSLQNLKLRYRTLRAILWIGALLICAAGVIKIDVIRDLSSFISAIILAIASCAVLIMIGHRVLRHRERQDYNRAKLCYQCGYDLRATRERCPECGEVIAAE